MQLISRVVRLAPLALLAALTPCCSDDDNVSVAASTGTLELHWTIGGKTDPDLCDRYGVAAFQATVIDRGYALRSFEVPCDEFSGSVELYVDDYVARVTLVDIWGYRLTERVVSSSFVLAQDEVEVVEIDFPEASFFSGGGAGGDGSGGAGAGEGGAFG